MSHRGSNLPGFRDAQIEFAAHIRNPEENPAPGDVEPQRMQVYLDLFYNNIESFLASTFPIAKKILGETRWHQLVREFVHLHPSESPYFLEISQEFLTFLNERQPATTDPALPGCLLELCHYEWVELALSVSEAEMPETGVDPEGNLLTAPVVISPLIWCLAYRFPVHQIGPGHVPEEPPPESTQLIVYRRRNDEVAFMVVNSLTLRLVALLGEADCGEAALAALIVEWQTARPDSEFDSNVVYEQGVATLSRLREAEIILGTSIRSE